MSQAVNMQNMQFRWPKAKRDTLRINDFSIEKGERVFIEGASGSGKTTLLGILAGVLSPQKGIVKILDTDVTSLTASKRDLFRADHIGYIFQLFNLLPFLNVIENTTLGVQFSARRKQKLKDSAAATAKQLLFSLGLSDEILQKPVRELSVGQQQRVATARALIGSPEILIADEPTSALDWNAREKFIQTLFQECESAGTTLIFVSHDHSLAKLFPRTVSLAEVNQA